MKILILKPSLVLTLVGLSLTSLFAEEKSGELMFYDDFNEAIAAAGESGKPVITIFSAKWCAPCQAMKKKVYPSSEVAPFHDSFVWAYLDTDQEKNRGLMEKFKVSGIPHISFVSASGEVIEETKGSMAPSDFAKVLTKTLEKAGAPLPANLPPPSEKKKGGFNIFNLFKKE